MPKKKRKTHTRRLANRVNVGRYSKLKLACLGIIVCAARYRHKVRWLGSGWWAGETVKSRIAGAVVLPTAFSPFRSGTLCWRGDNSVVTDRPLVSPVPELPPVPWHCTDLPYRISSSATAQPFYESNIFFHVAKLAIEYDFPFRTKKP
ncbi:unnamed protein product [Calypogeia fissa]